MEKCQTIEIKLEWQKINFPDFKVAVGAQMAVERYPNLQVEDDGFKDFQSNKIRLQQISNNLSFNDFIFGILCFDSVRIYWPANK